MRSSLTIRPTITTPCAVYSPIGYQFYGWSGWGLPVQVQGQIARGMGIHAQGVNQAEAQASQANRDEMTRRWNTFFWSAQHVANLARIAHRLPRDARDQANMEASLARIRDRPTAEEIERGVALNALLDQLTDPRIPPAAFRSSRTPLGPKLIQQAPYEYASEVITFLLERLTDDDRWPAFLAGQRFAEPRRALRSTLETAVEEDRAGELSNGTVRRVNLAVQRLAATAGANLPKASPSYAAAEAYLKEIPGWPGCWAGRTSTRSWPPWTSSRPPPSRTCWRSCRCSTCDSARRPPRPKNRPIRPCIRSWPAGTPASRGSSAAGSPREGSR